MNLPTLLAPVKIEPERQARLRIVRYTREDIQFREALILLDGQKIANLKFGDEIIIPVEPGPHTIQATNRVKRTKPQEFFAEAGEIIAFDAGNRTDALYNFTFVLFQMGVPKIFLKKRMHVHPLQEAEDS